jgi:hypothetical protein
VQASFVISLGSNVNYLFFFFFQIFINPTSLNTQILYIIPKKNKQHPSTHTNTITLLNFKYSHNPNSSKLHCLLHSISNSQNLHAPFNYMQADTILLVLSTLVFCKLNSNITSTTSNSTPQKQATKSNFDLTIQARSIHSFQENKKYL